MKILLPIKAREQAYALLTIMLFGGISLMIMGSALNWTSSNATQNDRNIEFFKATAAAEAATEKVLSKLTTTFREQGEGAVYNDLANMSASYPTAAENSWMGQYTFTDAQGNSAKTYVSRNTAWTWTNLESQYKGLSGMQSIYRIVSNVKKTGQANPFTVAVQQDIQIGTIPLFQFAIFYTVDCEINPGPVMNVGGRVHSNSQLYLQPQATLTFKEAVTAAKSINIGKSPLDPSSRTPGAVVFQKNHDGGVNTLTLPIGTNNSPAAVHAVIELPPAGESPTSLMGKQRYYNKADMVIIVSNATVTAKSGNFNGFATTIPWATDVSKFVATNASFYNKREGKTVQGVDVDVAKLVAWNATNTALRTPLGRDLNSIYVADMRTQTGTTESGVRLVNGAALPPQGLSVSTPNPAYIWGHYNAPVADRGTTNTANTKPASLAADAISVLSSAWLDANSSKSISSRIAADTTINTAFLAGNVPSNGTYYSGGVENYPRFLEDWGSKTFTYNGSMVVMFTSQIATAPWGGSDVYSPPNRNWAFDLNFTDSTKLPPGTPQATFTSRSKWAQVAPNQVN